MSSGTTSAPRRTEPFPGDESQRRKRDPQTESTDPPRILPKNVGTGRFEGASTTPIGYGTWPPSRERIAMTDLAAPPQSPKGPDSLGEKGLKGGALGLISSV